MNAMLKKANRMHETEGERWRAAWRAWERTLWEPLPDAVLVLMASTPPPENEGDEAFGRTWAGAFGVSADAPSEGDDARIEAAEAFVDWYEAVQEHAAPGEAVSNGDEPPLDLSLWPSSIPPPPEEPPGAWGLLAARLPNVSVHDERETCTAEENAVATGLFLLAFARAVRRAREAAV